MNSIYTLQLTAELNATIKQISENVLSQKSFTKFFHKSLSQSSFYNINHKEIVKNHQKPSKPL